VTLDLKLTGGESMIVNTAEAVSIDIDKMDERAAYEVYLKLKKRFDINVDCNIFTNCNYIGNCQCKHLT